MSTLKAPSVTITFAAAAVSAVQRSTKGTVALILRDAALSDKTYSLTSAKQIPAGLGATNQAAVSRAFLGYVNPPMTGTPLGTAIGTAVGGATGLLQGVTANETSKDTAMQSYAQNLIQSAENSSSSSLSTGSASAAQRQQDRLSFGTLLGSSQAASSVLGSIQTLANSTPYLYSDLTQIAKTLSVYGYTQSNLMINSVAVYNDACKRTAAYNSSEGYAALYGLMQSAIKASACDDPAKTAKQMLEDNGISTTITAQCIGSTKLITGNTAVVHEPQTGTDGLFWILSDSHSLSRGVYQTKVTLDFRNLMDKQEAGSVPTK